MGASVDDDREAKIREAVVKYEGGRAALRQDDFDKAIELLGSALELRVAVFGELAPECASAYFKYGTALFFKAQAETDPFGGPAQAATGKAAPTANGKATAKDEAEDEEEAEAEAEAEGAEGEGEEELEDEEEGDLELAWKLLETAKLIHERQPGHTVEEADIIATLADISLEKEDFATCLQDYGRALAILEGLLQPDDRMLAELCFKISLAHQLYQQPTEALSFCRRAISVCEARVKRLQETMVPFRGTGATGKAKDKGKVEDAEDGAQPTPHGTEIETDTVTETKAETETGTGTGTESKQEANGNGHVEQEGGLVEQVSGGAERKPGETENGESEGGGLNAVVESNGKSNGTSSAERTSGAAARTGEDTGGDVAAMEKEIGEIKALLVDLREKEEDLLQQAAAPSLEDALRAEHPEAFHSVRAIFSMAAGAGVGSGPGTSEEASRGPLEASSGGSSGVPSGATFGGPTGGQSGAANGGSNGTVTAGKGEPSSNGSRAGMAGSSAAAAPRPAVTSSGFDAPQLTAAGTGSARGVPTAVTNLGVVGRGVKRAAPVPLGGTAAASRDGSSVQLEPKRRTLDDMMKGGSGNGESTTGF